MANSKNETPQTDTPEDAPVENTTAAPAETEAPAPGDTAAKPAADDTALSTQAQDDDDDGKVAITLSNPIDRPDDIARLRLKPQDGGYPVGSTIRVTPADARAIIGSGYATIDPEDRQAVHDAVTGGR